MAYTWNTLLDKFFEVVWQGIEAFVNLFIDVATGMVESLWDFATTASNGYLYLLLLIIILFAGIAYIIGREMGVRGRISWKARGYYRAKVKKQRYDPIWKRAKRKHYFEGGGK